MGKEIDSEEFERLLQESRHQELADKLNSVIEAIQDKEDSGVIKAIEKQIKTIATLVSEKSEPENNKELIASVEAMQSSILQELSKLSNALMSKKEWEFTINKDLAGSIRSIQAKQTK